MLSSIGMRIGKQDVSNLKSPARCSSSAMPDEGELDAIGQSGNVVESAMEADAFCQYVIYL